MEDNLKHPQDAKLLSAIENLILILELQIQGQCCFRIVDESQNKLYKCIAPHLPQEIKGDANGILIEDNAGNCAAAAFRKEVICVTDISSDPIWSTTKEAPLKHGFLACWSTPIKNTQQQVMATLSVYFKEKKSPTNQELQVIKNSLQAFEYILETRNLSEELHEMQRTLEITQKLAHIGSWEQLLSKEASTRSNELLRLFEFNKKEIELLNTNKNFEKSFNLFAEKIHPEDREIMKQGYTDCISGKGKMDIKYRIQGKAIKYVHAIGEVRKRVVNNKKEKVFVGTLQDITTFVEASSHLKLLSSTIENSTDPIAIIRIGETFEDRTIQFANKALRDISGYSIDELLTKNPFEFFSPNTSLEEIDKYRKKLYSGQPTLAEVSLYKKDGSELFAEVHAFPITDDSGKITHVGVFFRETTERRKKDQEQKQKEINTLQALTNLPLLVVALDTNFNIIFWNKHAQKTLGYSAEEMLNNQTAFNLIMPGQNHAQILTKVADSLLNNTIPTIEMIAKDGTQKTLLIKNLSNYSFSDWKLWGVAIDATETKKLENDLKYSLEELEKVSQTLTLIQEEERRLIANNLHDEFGQILSVLKIHTTWLKNKTSIKDDKALKTIDEMTRLIQQAIDGIRRVSHNLFPVTLEKFGLVEAIRSDLQTLKNQGVLDFELDVFSESLGLDKNKEITVYRIFQEALTNILRHAQASKINIKINKSDDTFVINIGDNGGGFLTEDVKTRRTLGLIGIKDRVKSLNGDFEIKSQPGKGTVLSFQFQE